MGLLIESLDDDDDVQNVWHNWENPEEEEEDKPVFIFFALNKNIIYKSLIKVG